MWERIQEAPDWKPLPRRGGLGSEDPSAPSKSSHLQQGQNGSVCHSLLPSKRMSPVKQESPSRARVVPSGKGCGYPAGQK